MFQEYDQFGLYNESFEEFLEGLVVSPVAHANGHLPGIIPVLLLPLPLLIVDLDIDLNFALLGLKDPHTQVLAVLLEFDNFEGPQLHSLHEVGRRDRVLADCRSEEIAIIKSILIILFFVGPRIGHDAELVGVEQGLADLHHAGDESHQFAFDGALKLVVVLLVSGLGVLPADVNFDEDGILVEEVDLLEDLLEVSEQHEVVAAADLAHEHFEGDLIDPLGRVVGTPRRQHRHQGVALLLLVLALHQLHRHILPVPQRVHPEELPKQPVRVVVGEDLADLGDEDGPGDTSEIAHLVRADAPVLRPHLDQPQRRPKRLLILHCLQYHQVVLPAQQRRLALRIQDRLNQLVGEVLVDVLRHDVRVQLTEAYIDRHPAVLECDDRHARTRNSKEVFNAIAAFELTGQVFKKVLLPVDEVGHDADHVHVAVIGVESEHVAAEQQHLCRVVRHLFPRNLLLVLGDGEAPLLDRALQEEEGLLLTLLALGLLVEVVLDEDLLESLGLGLVALTVDWEQLALLQAIDYYLVGVWELR